MADFCPEAGEIVMAVVAENIWLEMVIGSGCVLLEITDSSQEESCVLLALTDSSQADASDSTLSSE